MEKSLKKIYENDSNLKKFCGNKEIVIVDKNDYIIY